MAVTKKRMKAPIDGDAAVEAVMNPTSNPSPQSSIVERGDVYGRIARARRMTSPSPETRAEAMNIGAMIAVYQ